MKLTDDGRARVEAWVERVVGSRSYRQFEDLHVDAVEAAFEARETWVSAAIALLDVAALQVGRLGAPVTPAVGFSLVSGEFPKGLSIESVDELTQELDDSPPSLYLFDRGAEPWRADDDCIEWGHSLGLVREAGLRYYLRQWIDDQDAEYRRSFWIAQRDGGVEG